MRHPSPRARSRPSLTFTLTISFLVFGVIALSLSSALQLASVVRAQGRAVANDHRAIAQDAARSVSDFIQDKLDILETATWLTSPYASSGERRKLELQSLLGLQPSFRELLLLDERDRFGAAVSRLPAQRELLDRLDAKALDSMRAEGRYLSPVYIDPVSGEPLMAIAIPMRDALKDFRGSLAAELNLTFMWDLVSTLKVRETGYAYVVDRRGTLIAFGDTARVLRGENVAGLRAVAEFIGDGERARAASAITYRGIYGKEVVGAYVPLGTPDWAVVTELPWNEAYREVVRQFFASAAITLALAALASLSGLFIARRLTVPLAKLMEAATRIAAGERGLQAAVGGPSEVASLAAAFNSMTAQLGASLAGLERQYAELERAEGSLRRANETTKALIEHSPLAIVMHDPEGRVAVWNGAAERMLGWTAEETIGGVLPFLREGDPLGIRALLARVAEKEIPADGSASAETEMELWRKDGSRIDVGVSLSPLRDPSGEVSAFIAIAADITERKRAEAALRESEERFRALVETTSDWVWETDRDGVYTYASPRVAEALGYAPEEILGKSLFDLMPPGVAEAAAAEFRAFAGSGKPFLRAEYEKRRKDGRTAIVESSGAPAFGEDGGLRGYRGIDRDISEIKKAREEQARLQEQLQQAMKMEAIGQLAGGVAHDFNNLLTVIIGNVDLASLKLDPSDPAMAFFDPILAAAESAAGLTRQLLAFARRQLIQPKILCLNDLVEKFRKSFIRLLGEDIALRTALDPGLGNVRVDPGQIEQVLVNLATNARAAMPTGGELLIETSNARLDEAYCAGHAEARPGEYALLAVSDTGQGMSEETKSHIFEPFFTTKPVGQGTGLGLATVFGIVKQSRGTIEVYSEEGRGTQFKIYLPIAAEAGEGPGREEPEFELPTGNQTIVVAEDNEGVRRSAVLALESLHYRVLSSPSVDEIIALAAGYGGRVDLLITDVVMPRMNGPELAARLRSLHPGIKVLFTSGYTYNVIAQHGIVNDGLDFLPKPYTVRALAEKVKRVLSS